MRTNIFIILSFIWLPFLNGQQLNDEQLEYLNKEIRFLNETIHRMVIVFQVYENYNSEVTKHVDLPTNEGIKNTSTHLPKNLFADNNLVRQGDSPLELYDALKADPVKDGFPYNNWQLIEETRGVINFLNKDRHLLDQIIDNEDLELFSNIQKVYGEIEQAIDYYDKVRSSVRFFEKLHIDAYDRVDLPKAEKQVYKTLTELHYDIKKLVRQLRVDNRSGVQNDISKIEKGLRWTRTCIAELSNPDQKTELGSALVSIEKLVEGIQNYIGSTSIPAEYDPFGKGYYYHNYELLPKINQYGSGYVWKLEEFFKKYNWPVVNFLEEPHYLKIVYPNKIPLEIMKSDEIDPDANIRDLDPPSLPVIDNLIVGSDEVDTENTATEEIEEEAPEEPEKVDLPYSIVLEESIRVDSAFFEIELFDHYKKDGDRVSISVNGEWVHRLISLETGVTKLKLQIKPGQSNRVIIRADNVGWNPPNTIGIRYRDKDPSKTVTIEKDLTYSQAVAIDFIN